MAYKFHICFILLWLTASILFAQHTGQDVPHIHPQPHPVLSQIQSNYQQGEISLDQKILFQFYAGLQPESLPSSYKTSSDPIKCGVPIIREYQANRDQLSAAIIQQVETMLQPATQEQYTYTSPSGKFNIHYDTSGEDAVPEEDTNRNDIPDYVEQIAAAADSSWRHEVQRLGHSDPVISSAEPYDIYFRNFNSYGQTVYSNATTYIEIHNNFDNFPQNTDPEGNQAGAIKVTVAHELKHAIQYANSKWYGYLNEPNYPPTSNSPHSTDWSEMDATFMEEVVYDNVNDYYNYIENGSSSIFVTSSHSLPVAYDGVTWFIYFQERFGDAFWPAVWNRIEARYQAQQGQPNPDYLIMLEAITITLQEDYGETFEDALAESHLWHYASGIQNSRMGFGFEEKEEYPDPNINATLIARDSSSTRRLNALSADYIRVSKEPMLEGRLQVRAEFDTSFTNIGLLGYFTDGSVRPLTRPGNSTGSLTINTDWDWNNLQHLGIVVANSSNSASTRYKLTVTSLIPEEVELAQNYPNPFNPRTTIEFGLPQQSYVELAVYDITGRKVATLRDEVLPADFYKVEFNGRNLASGVYFYRLITDQRVLVKKMTFIK